MATWGKFLIATLLPFIIIVYGYLGIYGLSTGDYQLGFSRYSYITFEHGHRVLFNSDFGNATLEAAREATRVFGTPAENNFFFLNAIRRNPELYFERIKIIIRQVPSSLLEAYGKRYAAVLFLFALRGAWELLRKKSYAKLAALILWSAHMGAYFLVGFIRLNYYRIPFFIIFTLASIGLFSSITGYQNAREKRLLTIGLSALAIYGIFDNKLAIFVGASIMLLGIWSIWTVINNLAWKESKISFALALCLSLGLMIRADYPSPGLQEFGDEAIEQAHIFLVENLEPGSRVMASETGYPLAARMQPLVYPSELRNLESSEDLYQWLLENDIDALRTTSWLSYREPVVWSMIEELIDNGLEQGFRSDPGDIRILIVRPPNGE
jgi:hypothetical protein